ncbi:unnamed protein product [Amoebophrya sp. A120]|nr:unnamed protein product [Amoebophrya sp. A120]|eukprot:GSA120T00016683001.1
MIPQQASTAAGTVAGQHHYASARPAAPSPGGGTDGFLQSMFASATTVAAASGATQERVATPSFIKPQPFYGTPPQRGRALNVLTPVSLAGISSRPTSNSPAPQLAARTGATPINVAQPVTVTGTAAVRHSSADGPLAMRSTSPYRNNAALFSTPPTRPVAPPTTANVLVSGNINRPPAYHSPGMQTRGVAVGHRHSGGLVGLQPGGLASGNLQMVTRGGARTTYHPTAAQQHRPPVLPSSSAGHQPSNSSVKTAPVPPRPPVSLSSKAHRAAQQQIKKQEERQEQQRNGTPGTASAEVGGATTGAASSASLSASESSSSSSRAAGANVGAATSTTTLAVHPATGTTSADACSAAAGSSVPAAFAAPESTITSGQQLHRAAGQLAPTSLAHTPKLSPRPVLRGVQLFGGTPFQHSSRSSSLTRLGFSPQNKQYGSLSAAPSTGALPTTDVPPNSAQAQQRTLQAGLAVAGAQVSLGSGGPTIAGGGQHPSTSTSASGGAQIRALSQGLSGTPSSASLQVTPQKGFLQTNASPGLHFRSMQSAALMHPRAQSPTRTVMATQPRVAQHQEGSQTAAGAGPAPSLNIAPLAQASTSTSCAGRDDMTKAAYTPGSVQATQVSGNDKSAVHLYPSGSSLGSEQAVGRGAYTEGTTQCHDFPPNVTFATPDKSHSIAAAAALQRPASSSAASQVSSVLLAGAPQGHTTATTAAGVLQHGLASQDQESDDVGSSAQPAGGGSTLSKPSPDEGSPVLRITYSPKIQSNYRPLTSSVQQKALALRQRLAVMTGTEPAEPTKPSFVSTTVPVALPLDEVAPAAVAEAASSFQARVNPVHPQPQLTMQQGSSTATSSTSAGEGATRSSSSSAGYHPGEQVTRHGEPQALPDRQQGSTLKRTKSPHILETVKSANFQNSISTTTSSAATARPRAALVRKAQPGTSLNVAGARASSRGRSRTGSYGSNTGAATGGSAASGRPLKQQPGMAVGSSLAPAVPSSSVRKKVPPTASTGGVPSSTGAGGAAGGSGGKSTTGGASAKLSHQTRNKNVKFDAPGRTTSATAAAGAVNATESAQSSPTTTSSNSSKRQSPTGSALGGSSSAASAAASFPSKSSNLVHRIPPAQPSTQHRELVLNVAPGSRPGATAAGLHHSGTASSTLTAERQQQAAHQTLKPQQEIKNDRASTRSALPAAASEHQRTSGVSTSSPDHDDYAPPPRDFLQESAASVSHLGQSQSGQVNAADTENDPDYLIMDHYMKREYGLSFKDYNAMQVEESLECIRVSLELIRRKDAQIDFRNFVLSHQYEFVAPTSAAGIPGQVDVASAAEMVAHLSVPNSTRAAKAKGAGGSSTSFAAEVAEEERGQSRGEQPTSTNSSPSSSLKHRKNRQLIQRVVESVCALLQFHDLRWASILGYVSKGMFEQRLNLFQINKVPRQTFLRVKEYLLDPHGSEHGGAAEADHQQDRERATSSAVPRPPAYDEEAVLEVSAILAPYARFVRSAMFYLQLTRHKSLPGPEIANLKAHSQIPQFNVNEYREWYQAVKAQFNADLAAVQDSTESSEQLQGTVGQSNAGAAANPAHAEEHEHRNVSASQDQSVGGQPPLCVEQGNNLEHRGSQLHVDEEQQKNAAQHRPSTSTSDAPRSEAPRPYDEVARENYYTRPLDPAGGLQECVTTSTPVPYCAEDELQVQLSVAQSAAPQQHQQQPGQHLQQDEDRRFRVVQQHEETKFKQQKPFSEYHLEKQRKLTLERKFGRASNYTRFLVDPGEFELFPDLDTLDPSREDVVGRHGSSLFVHELTVHKRDVGQVTFHGVTDVRGINFREVVQLSRGCVVVYPPPLFSEETKPPVGEGLNKPASVIMYNCLPPANFADPQAYLDRVRNMTVEKGAEFLGYDGHSGIWQFRVKHFGSSPPG